MELAENEEPEGHAKAVPTPHPSSWGFILLRGLPRLQEGRGFLSSLRGAEPSQWKEGRPGAVLGLMWVWVEQNLCAPLLLPGPSPPSHTTDSDGLCLKSCTL